MNSKELYILINNNYLKIHKQQLEVWVGRTLYSVFIERVINFRELCVNEDNITYFRRDADFNTNVRRLEQVICEAEKHELPSHEYVCFGLRYYSINSEILETSE